MFSSVRDLHNGPGCKSGYAPELMIWWKSSRIKSHLR
jgi:hypothetical protein